MFVIVLGLLVLGSGCSRTVAGAPSEAAGAPPAKPGSAGNTFSATARARAPALQSDVLADECLLDAGQLAALLGRPVRAPAQSVVRRDDGSRRAGCYVVPAEGGAAPVVAINVYRVRSGTPAQFVATRSAGGRRLAGIGEAATVLDTAAGPTLQVASARFVVTVVVRGRDPGDAAWRAAARHALARLPG